MQLSQKFDRLLHPRPARWFEIYVPRVETVYAVEALAQTGAVQLELDPRQAHPFDIAGIRRSIQQIDAFCAAHRLSLPLYSITPSQLEKSPEETAQEALEYLHHWAERLFRLQEELQRLQGERENLLLLAECLTAVGGAGGIERFAHPTGFLSKGIYACPHDHPMQARFEDILVERARGRSVDFLLLAGLPERQEEIDRAVTDSPCIRVDPPEWLPPDRAGQEQALQGKLDALATRIRLKNEALIQHREDGRLKAVLANLAVLRWFAGHASTLTMSQHYCHITGWTTAEDPDLIQRTLDRAHIHAVARYTLAPFLIEPPLSMTPSRWGSPFRMFAGLAGTPGRGEIDPSLVVPLVVPLLFGFMFPDLGHGGLIALAGALGRRRWPQVRFLLPCGISSMLFGLLFGDLFGLQGAIPALWFHPLDEPLRVLGASLWLGAVLILSGLLFSALEAWWRGEWRRWVLVEGAVLVLYALVLAAVIYRPLDWLVPIPLLWYLGGSLVLQREEGRIDLPLALGRLVQTGFELFLNSFSFIRVGAFALAHAGLALTVVKLTAIIDTPWLFWPAVVLGHLLVILIEGGVVLVQTTRLLLFEFFIRFLHADGRVFRPLAGPGGSMRR